MTRVKKKTFFVPIKPFFTMSLIEQIRIWFNRTEFEENIEKTRTEFAELQAAGNNRKDKPKMYSDVYSGSVWEAFQNLLGFPFLSEAGDLAFMLHVDWFQPFERTQYSLGAIYIVCLNLPPDQRMK